MGFDCGLTGWSELEAVLVGPSLPLFLQHATFYATCHFTVRFKLHCWLCFDQKLRATRTSFAIPTSRTVADRLSTFVSMAPNKPAL